MLRHLYLIPLVLSLLLFAATIWLWVRSYQGPDELTWQTQSGRLYELISGHGTFDILCIPRWPQKEGTRYYRENPHVYYGTRYSKRLLGFGTDVIWPEYGGRYVNIPHWFVTCICAGAAFLFARVWWRRRVRDLAGRCGKCGYDMRATPQRCPECGSIGVGSAPADATANAVR